MGMESYQIYLVLPEVQFYVEDNLRKLKGATSVTLNEFHAKLIPTDIVVKRIRDNVYMIDEVIEMIVIVDDRMMLKLITLTGCFCWFEGGVELCQRLIRYIQENIMEVHPNVLGVYLEENGTAFMFEQINDLYSEKLIYFKKGLADVKAKVASKDFSAYRRKYLRKQNSLFTRIKKFFS